MFSLIPQARVRPKRFLDNRGRPTFSTLGMPASPWRDLYHRILDMRWRWFVGLALVLYLSVHVLFAGLYLLEPGSINNSSGSFRDAYFFSVQTMMTIGYGGMTPATLWANAVVTFEAFVGLFLTAMLTGIVFAKFSRPTSNVVFSKVAVISEHDGKPTLQIRLANARGNRILEASLTVVMGTSEQTAEGKFFRRLRDLHLVRRSSPLFSVSWTAMHVIDDKSPLAGETAESLAAKAVEIMAVMTGLDETSSQSVHARYSYFGDEIRFGERFVDIIHTLPSGERMIDYRRFHDTEAASAPS